MNNKYRDWYAKSRKEKSNEEIEQFNNEILCETHHNYESICHAIAASTLTHLHNCLYRYGATGSQVSYITWQIIRQMFNIKTGAKLINFDKMLYPQYEWDFEFDNELSIETFKGLQELAKEQLASSKGMSDSVREHMQSIVDGKVPFGYFVGVDSVE